MITTLYFRTVIMNPLMSNSDAAREKHSSSMKLLKSNALHLLSILLNGEAEQGHFSRLDMLNVLMVLIVAAPSLPFPDDDRNFLLGREDAHLVLLCFLAHIVQVLLGFQDDSDEALDEASFSDVQAVDRLWKQVSSSSGKSNLNVPENLAAKLKNKLTHFLRCVALFFHFYTDVNLPEDSSFEGLTSYLGLPGSLRDALMILGAQDIVDRLLKDKRSIMRSSMAELPPKMRTLIPLPPDYVTLIDRAAKFKCPNNVTGECRNPSLCLLCDEILCSQSHCCETWIKGKKCGSCTAHAKKCGASKGIFLRLRRCEVALICDFRRGMMLPAPYVDEYGESDEGLRRGNPLKFDAEIYEELNRVWTNNDIPDKISRSFDEDQMVVGTNWHTL